jgi:hypothetical protein
MAKRKREDDSTASCLRTTILEGLGKPKRVKSQQSNCVADKENRLPESKPPSKPSLQSRVSGAKNPRNGITTKRKVSSGPLLYRPVLQPKCLNVSAQLKKYPISKHIINPNSYKDEGWIGQQQVLMTSILNEVLETHSSQSKIWKEKDLDLARTKAFDYYQSDEFQIIVRRLNSVSLQPYL